jgi:hypothetical protein
LPVFYLDATTSSSLPYPLDAIQKIMRGRELSCAQHKKEQFIMKNILLSFAATTALTLASGVYAEDASSQKSSNLDYKDNGGYTATVKDSQTTSNGTDINSKTTADVDVDSNGNTTKTIKSKTTEDPKGLWNKKTHTGKLTYQDKDNGGYSKTLKTSDTDRAGTDTSLKSKTDVDVDKSGNVTKTTETDKVTDPSGLMNKTETVTKSKTVNGVVVEDSRQDK